MLDATHKKLREAAFFLDLIRTEQTRFVRREPEACDFYLSAFLSAARSVGDVVRTEGGEEYAAWWAQRKMRLTAQESDLLAFTNDQRVNAVHVRGPEVSVSVVSAPMWQYQQEVEKDGGVLDIRAGGVPGNPMPMPEAIRQVLKFKDPRWSNLISVCSDWLLLMQNVVTEYEKRVVA